MSFATITDREVIAELGGVAAVADALDCKRDAVKKWVQKDRAIPWKMRSKVKALADKRRKRLPADFLDTRRRGEGAAA